MPAPKPTTPPARATAGRACAVLLFTPHEDVAGAYPLEPSSSLVVSERGDRASVARSDQAEGAVVIYPLEQQWWVKVSGAARASVDRRRVKGRSALPSGSILRVGDTFFEIIYPYEVDLYKSDFRFDRIGPIVFHQDGREHVIGLVGGPRLRAAIDTLPRLAPKIEHLLIFGESGTGKEATAGGYHDLSGSAGKLVPVNCAALSPSLVDSELFGHERGAFTGAVQAKRGLFEEADDGTIFLDEIGELPPEVQAKLLRVLEKGEIRPVGSASSRNVRVRVVGATHKNLQAMSQRGEFRGDLLGRLNQWSLTLPPLRERREDIFMLARTFSGARGIGADTMEILLNHAWRGSNVRELKHCITYAAALAEGDQIHAIEVEKHLAKGESDAPALDHLEAELPTPQAPFNEMSEEQQGRPGREPSIRGMKLAEARSLALTFLTYAAGLPRDTAGEQLRDHVSKATRRSIPKNRDLVAILLGVLKSDPKEMYPLFYGMPHGFLRFIDEEIKKSRGGLPKWPRPEPPKEAFQAPAEASQPHAPTAPANDEAPPGSFSSRPSSRAPAQPPAPVPSAAESTNTTVSNIYTVVVARLAAERGATEGHGREALLSRLYATAKGNGRHVEAQGDHVIALFGLDAGGMLDAVEAATIMRREARDLIRVGVGAGRVLASASAGALRGEGINAAMTGASAASAGEIILSAAVYRGVERHFVAEPVPEPAASLKLGSRRRPRATMPPTDFYDAPTKLVARGAEIARLKDRLDNVRAESTAEMLLFTGEEGSGKTRLFAEAWQRCQGPEWGAVVLAAQCTSRDQSTGYNLILSLLRMALGLGSREQLVTVEDQIRAWVGSDAASPLGASLTTVATVLCNQSEAPQVRHHADQDRGPDSRRTRNIFHDRLAQGVERLLRQKLMHQPVVILCDDIQWADEASLSMLGELVRVHLRDQPLLIVGFASPAFHEGSTGFGAHHAEALVRCPINLLQPGEIQKMARDRLGTSEPKEFFRQLAELAEGKPLHLQEILHLCADAGVIERSGSGRWVIREKRLSRMNLPPRIQDLAERRLNKLDAKLQETLQLASVFDDRFWLGAVAHLLGPGADVAALEKSLDELCTRRLVHAVATSSVPGDRELVFAGRSLRGAAYASIKDDAKRKILHGRAAAWLSERFKGVEDAAGQASHFEAAGEVEEAAKRHARAARYAASKGQNDEAVHHFSRALEGASSWRQQVELLLELGEVARRATRVPLARKHLEDALRSIDGAASASDAPADRDLRLQLRSRVNRGLAALAYAENHLEQARELLELAIAEADTVGALEEIPMSCALLAQVIQREQGAAVGPPVRPWLARGKDGKFIDIFARARGAVLRGIGAYRALPAQKRHAATPVVLLLTLGTLYYKLAKRAEKLELPAARVDAHLRQARAWYQGALLFAGSQRSAEHRHAKGNLAIVDFEKKRYERARDAWLEALRESEEAGDFVDVRMYRNNLAEVELHLDNKAAALEHAEEAKRLAEGLEIQVDFDDILKNYTAALRANGRSEEADKVSAYAVRAASARKPESPPNAPPQGGGGETGTL